MTIKGSKRKSKAEFLEEHQHFITFVKQGQPELEIMTTLELSKAQLKAHTLMALQEGELSPEELIPDYEVVFARSLPNVLRTLLPNIEDNSLIQARSTAEGLLLTCF